jgi:hypothetical protein
VNRRAAYRWFKEGTLLVPAELGPADCGARSTRRPMVWACGGELVRVRDRAERYEAEAVARFVRPRCQGDVVERRDWLAGFGVARLEAALCAQSRRFVVADPGETSGVLVRVMIEVFTSMCARPYGLRWRPRSGDGRADGRAT